MASSVKNSAIAIIPARGGSKRLPRKNILNFCGKPMILYSVESAIASGCFQEVIVSTEDPEIAAVVKSSGCTIHQRPVEIASDTARVNDVIKSVLSSRDLSHEYLCCLYATSPLRTANDIQNSFEELCRSNSDACWSVSEYSKSPFYAYNLSSTGAIQARWPDLRDLPNHEKPAVVHDNGSIYWSRVDSFLKNNDLYGAVTTSYLMPLSRSVDIDTQGDFDLAEMYANKKT
ncbi:acylneuraminate cytidylyltransferase family protein [bacterium]|jgi:pseudaminic acid cytidylyltransferase|nr:acylneuraminate cytidylyltransferase family protein [bacterium]